MLLLINLFRAVGHGIETACPWKHKFLSFTDPLQHTNHSKQTHREITSPSPLLRCCGKGLSLSQISPQSEITSTIQYKINKGVESMLSKHWHIPNGEFTSPPFCLRLIKENRTHKTNTGEYKAPHVEPIKAWHCERAAVLELVTLSVRQSMS